MEKIKMVDLEQQYLQIKSEVDIAIQDVLNSTAFIQGPQVNQFATALAIYLETNAVVPCANGTDALQIAMMALGLRPGDEVILPAFTYVATAEAIALLGLIPVFVDVKEDTFNIDVDKLESKITSKTKAIVPVHLFGQCADMEKILQLGVKHNLFVIEDTAQALGSVYTFSNGEKKKAGTIGIIGTTSFFPSKNLGCFGDGGAMITNDMTLAEKVKIIANHGQRVKYYHESIGVNSRLDTLQAAVLNVKLKYLPEYEKKRNEAAAFYDHALKNISEIEIPTRLEHSTHVFHQYTLKAKKRDDLRQYLEERSIPSMIYYPVPLHLQKAYQTFFLKEGSFPIAEKLSKEVLSLPIHTEMKELELDFICQAIKDFYHG